MTMKVKKIVALCLSLMFGLIGFCQSGGNQTKFNPDTVYATYQYRSKTGLSVTTINFRTDGTFEYLSGTDLEERFSKGIWKKIKDTFFLASFLKKNDLPIQIEEHKDSLKDSVVINWVKDLRG